MAIDARLYSYKGNRCANCGSTIKDVAERYGVTNTCFEFHHIDARKKAPNYDNLIRRKKLSAEHLNEVDKCQLLCRNCHGIQQGQGGEGTFTLTLEINDRVLTQTLDCSVIVDFKDKKFTALTDGQILMVGFVMKRGQGDQEIITALELNDGRLLEYMLETRENGEFRIWDKDGKPVFRVTRKDQDLCDGRFTVAFTKHSSLTFEQHDERGRLKVAVRRGQAILPDSVIDTGEVKVVWTYRGLEESVANVRAQKINKAS